MTLPRQSWHDSSKEKIVKEEYMDVIYDFIV